MISRNQLRVTSRCLDNRKMQRVSGSCTTCSCFGVYLYVQPINILDLHVRDKRQSSVPYSGSNGQG